MQTCSPTGHLQLMRSGLLFCLCYTHPGFYEYLLRRRPGDWFPHIPSNLEYWHELSSRDVFRGMKRQELRTQMMWLLLKLIEFSDGRTPSRILRHQPSDRFSAIQNRSLCAEIFRVSSCTFVSFNSFDPARLSIDLPRSVLFHQCPKTDPTDLEKWKTGLTQLLPIDPPAHNVSSRNPCMSPALIKNVGLAPYSWYPRASGYQGMREGSLDEVRKSTPKSSISNK